MTQVTPASASKVRPNDPCWCGSGKKFKRCHKVSTARVLRGTITPRRDVPPDIARPPWAATGGRK